MMQMKAASQPLHHSHYSTFIDHSEGIERADASFGNAYIIVPLLKIVHLLSFLCAPVSFGSWGWVMSCPDEAHRPFGPSEEALLADSHQPM